MKTRPLSWLALLTGLLLTGPTLAAGTQFSADMVQKAGGQTQTMRYYQGDQKVRTEMKAPDGQQAISILDMQARKMFTLMPAEKMYMEIPLGADTAAWAADDKTREEYYEVRKVGTEKVNGYLCDKYELIPKKQGLEKSTTWIAQKLGYPVKSVGKNFTMELTNIKEGTQPASLFAVPKGYQKMPGMDDYRGMMQQNGAAAPRSGQRAAEDDNAGTDAMPEALRKGLRGLFGKE